MVTLAVTLVAGLLTTTPVRAQDPDLGGPPPGREELVGRRTQTSKTFRNDDGTLTTRLFSGPVHFRGPDGRWKEIDSSLVPTERGAYALRNAANEFDVLFKDQVSDGYVRFSAGGMNFDFTLSGAARAAGVRQHGTGVTFRSALPEVDLDYEVVPSGLKETLVLNDSTVPTKYRFVMEASGPGAAQVTRTPEGAWAVFTSHSADPAFVFAPPTVTEGPAAGVEPPAPEQTPQPTASPVASPEPSPALSPEPLPSEAPSPEASAPNEDTAASPDAVEEEMPSEAPVTEHPATPAPESSDPDGRPRRSKVDARQMQSAATLDVHELGKNRFAIELAVDPQWLHDPERRFPVLLDPTVVRVQPTAEDVSYAWLCGSCTGNVDFRTYIGTGYQDIWRSALKFDTSPIPVGSVTKAELGLYHDGGCVANAPTCTSSSHSLDVHRMTNAWTAATPVSGLGFQAVPLSNYTLAAGATGWMKWDVTSAAQDWVANPTTNHGLLVKRTTEALGVGGAVAPLGHRHWDVYRRPTLDVTYTDLPVTLEVPETWHSNGAELSWTRFNSSVGGAFTGYEVHRSDNRDFRPSADTLLATISDVGTTRFVDTTAGSSRTYSYRIRTGSISSNAETGVTPAAGMATKVLNGKWNYEGDDTHLMFDKNYEVCDSFGYYYRMWVGSTSWSKLRSLVRFDLGDIPRGSVIESAKLRLHQEGWIPAAGLKVNVHRATRDWLPGNAWGGCTWPGANWYKTDGVTRWATDGGDFDPTVEASITTDGSTSPKWDQWDTTALVRRWVNGEVPNFGMLLKAETEPLAGDARITYDSFENYHGEHFNPRLEILYRDGSRSQGPSVAIATPGSGERVRGSTPVKVTATDDRKVTKVELLVDGALVATDAAAPYEFAWSSTSVANGARSLTAKAYDDVGNTTTSAAVSVDVANSAPPTAQITAPAGGNTVSGAPTVSATATDDTGVDKVEFYFDGYRFGEDLVPDGTTYTAPWNTLDPLLPAYNGTHQLTAVAVDKHGQRTESAAVTVTVVNAPGTKFKAGFTATALPQAIAFDPNPPSNCGTGTQLCPQQTHGVDLTATNTSGVTWLASEVVARYRWYAADGTLAATGPNVSLGTNVAPGTAKQVRLSVSPPTLPNGVDRGQYTLRLDLFDIPTGAYFADKGNAPVDASVTVHRLKLTDQLGLERFYHYEGRALGAGMSHLVNVASGNSLVRWTPFASPGRGLSTVVDLTYNSLEDKSDSPAGNNFSLSISGLTRFGNPLDVHPNKADEIAGNSRRYIRLIDGDGTTHEFTGKQASDGTIYWEEPEGVHLFLRAYSTTNANKKWALTRPDRVTFFYDADGYPTSVEDANGNKLVFGLEQVPPGEDPGGPSKRITTITDAAGVDGVTNRKFTVDYYSKDEAKKPQIRGNVQSVTDHNGSALLFDYYEDGNLLRLTQKGGTNADGSFLADRTFVFTYTTSSGSGAAITDAAARANPDPKTPNQSTRLYSVRDPRGNETTFTYLGSGAGTSRWKLASLKDRDGDTSSIQYDTVARKTTITAPLSRVTTYGFDSEGKVTSIVNPKNETTTIGWTTDRHVATVTEPTLEFTEYKYNANGYLTEVRDQLGHATLLEYDNLAVPGESGTADNRDSALYWKTGRSIPHLSQLKKITDPRGNFSSFVYDAKGNLKISKDEAGFDTLFDYDPANGNLTKVIDANGNPITFSRYDANGFPQEIRNAENEATELSYDADGLLRWLQTPRHSPAAENLYNTFYFDYDSFHRLGRQSSPKSSGEAVWSGMDFDPNDNVLTQLWAAPGTPGTIAGATGSKTRVTYDAMDRTTVIDGPNAVTSTQPTDDLTKMAYDDAGRLTSVTSPKGVATAVADDFATIFAYDALDRTTSQTRYLVDSAGNKVQTRRAHYCYNTAGDLTSVTAPKANLASVTCGTTLPFTTTYTYDDAHRVKAVTRPGTRVRSFWYDANGNVMQIRNERNDDTFLEYDKRNMLETVREPFDGTRQIVTRHVYDPVGNLKKLVSPKAWDASPDVGINKTNFPEYVTDYVYDKANRVTAVMLPARAAGERHYVHRMYDDDGNLTRTSLPVAIPPNADGSWPAVPELLTTEIGYMSNGWVQSTKDGANPFTTYGYTPEGWQASRNIGPGEDEHWSYNPDGTLKTRDRAGQAVSYEYDANGNVNRIVDGLGKNNSRDNLEMRIVYNGFDEVAEVRHQEETRPDDDANWSFTTYAYDLNGNLTERVDDGAKGTDGVVRGRRHIFSYNEVGWLTAHRDWGKGNDCTDDQWTDNDYLANGLQEYRVIKRAGASCTLSPDQPSWEVKQGTKWTYAKNGDLTQLLTKNSDPRPSAPVSGTTIESHMVEYVATVDGKTLYFNGHRTKDSFTLSKSGHQCVSAGCKLEFTYDARDRLRVQKRTLANGTFTEKSWELDPAGNIIKETVPATATAPAVTREFAYDGTRLKTLTAGGTTVRHLYDPHGNLDCIVKNTYAGSSCPKGGADLLTDYVYDAFDRLKGYESLGGDGVVDDSVSYEYDVLDRVEKEKETHPGFKRNIDFTYVGLTSQVATEVHDDPTSATPTARDVTKSYGYDAFGLRVSLTNAPAIAGSPGVGKAGTFTYAYDVHGSVSALLDHLGNVETTYGYDAYGAPDPQLTQGDNDPLLQLNPYRYTGKRTDVGSGTIDMGARRFSSDSARFLQPDFYMGALANLGLSMDPLSGNRYSLAAGNPVSFVEVDGHRLADIGNGGGQRTSGGSGREAPGPGSINAAEGPVDHDAVKRSFFWDCEGMCESATYKAERYETSLTLARSGIPMRCQENCPDLRDSFLYKVALGDVDNCFSGLTSMELRGSCVLALIGGVADEAAAGGKGIYRAARGVENADDLVDAGTGIRRVGSSLDSIHDVLANPQLLAGRTPAELEMMLGATPGWKVETLRRGSQSGQGWMLREYTSAGNLTGRLIQWHPGGGHHGEYPYWKVSSPEGGTQRIFYEP